MKLENKSGDCTLMRIKRCPRCEAVISQSKRYGQILGSQKVNVMKVKQKISIGEKNKIHLQYQKFNQLDSKKTKNLWKQNFPELWKFIIEHLVRIIPGKGKNAREEIVPLQVNTSIYKH